MGGKEASEKQEGTGGCPVSDTCLKVTLDVKTLSAPSCEMDFSAIYKIKAKRK